MRAMHALVIIAIVTIISRKKDSQNNVVQKKQSFDIEIKDSIYYKTEIFPEQYLSIYDNWCLKSASGGFSGGHINAGFDHLVFQKYGIFKAYKNDSLMLYGKVQINSNDKNGLLISLVTDSMVGNVSFFDMVKYVYLHNDTLNLQAPCCDRYSYDFIRCSVFTGNSFYQQNRQLGNVSISKSTPNSIHSFY